MELAQLLRDRCIALRVSQPDRRGDVERALAARLAAHPAARRRRAREVTQEQVDLDRISRVRRVARTVERDESPARQLGELGTGRMRPDRIVPAVDDEDGTAHARGQLASLVGVLDTACALRRDEHLRRRLERPVHGVLDLLGRVRLGEHLREEELEEVGVMLEPVLAVVLQPSLVRIELLVERDHGAASRRRRAERQRRSDEDHALDALGMVRREEQGALRSHREPDDECTLRRGRIQHRHEHQPRTRPRRRPRAPAGGPNAHCRADRR